MATDTKTYHESMHEEEISRQGHEEKINHNPKISRRKILKILGIGGLITGLGAIITNRDIISSEDILKSYNEKLTKDLKDKIRESYLLLDIGDSTPISSPVSFDRIRNELDGRYHLTQDLNFGGAFFTPIGYQSEPFRGILDGRGYSIKDLRIKTEPYPTNTGLFTEITRDAIIANLTLEAISISGAYSVGALVGKNSEGTILNCSVGSPDKKVDIIGASDTGGLVGHNFRGLLGDCSVYANITCPNLSGIAMGTNYEGSIINFYGEGTVSGENAGLLIGINQRGDVVNIQLNVKTNNGKKNIKKLINKDTFGTIENPFSGLFEFFSYPKDKTL